MANLILLFPLFNSSMIMKDFFPEDSESPPYICKIIAMKKEEKFKVAHVRWFARGENTIFGDLADPKEVFAVYDCEDVELFRFIRPLHIQHSPVEKNWSTLATQQ